ncbi:hypothetical protein [Sphingomonas sp.]|uniref:hypothetical protein n=1 Tax=Sphingomonas sp. TaxID=28214 RepID=UPI003D6D8C94
MWHIVIVSTLRSSDIKRVDRSRDRRGVKHHPLFERDQVRRNATPCLGSRASIRVQLPHTHPIRKQHNLDVICRPFQSEIN